MAHCIQCDSDIPDSQWPSADARKQLRTVFTNEVIRAIGSLARQQNVCREQGGEVVFVTGMEAAREYILEQFIAAQALVRSEGEKEKG